MARTSTLAILPTGFGKSVCYQLPARAFREHASREKTPAPTVLVVSPLIALMKDQVDQAKARGLKATFINSSLNSAERFQRQKRLMAGEFEICYVTPERFRKAEFWTVVAALEIPFLAVDEAHCIAEWGHDFRPDYSRLLEVRQRIEALKCRPLPVLAVTATATPEVQSEIQGQLGFTADEMPVITGNLARPNLALEVWDVLTEDQKIQALIAIRFQNPGPIVVYSSLIATLRKTSRALLKLGVPHLTYHGDLNDRERRQNQDAFFTGDRAESQFMLATPAFGLGVDKADIRAVVHIEFPRSLESYFQEAGRGGRDGGLARAILLFDEEDALIQMDFINWANPDPGFVRHIYQLIKTQEDRVAQEGTDFLRAQMNFYNRRDFRVETAIHWLERWGAIEWDTAGQFNRAVNPKGRLHALQDPAGEWLTEAHHAERLKHQNQRLLSVIQYAKNREQCRQQLILNYLGQKEAARCLICDVCTKINAE